MTTQQQTQAALPEGRFRRWIMNHDDSWLFIVPYIGLAVVLSIVLSLFWLIVVVAVHFALEALRQWWIKPGWGVISRTLWELKLDIGLILFGLALALYLELTLGMVGLGSAARTGAMTGARFVIIQRVLRGILLSLDDLAQVARVFFRRKKPSNGEADVEIEESPPSGWHGNWSRGDYISLGFGAICLLLIVLAPFITEHTFESTIETLVEELQPLPPPEID